MFKSMVKKTLLSLMALTLLTTGSFATLSLDAPKASAEPNWYVFPHPVGHSYYSATVKACKETVNTIYGPLYKVTVVASNPRETAGNFLQLVVMRQGRPAARVSSNAWYGNPAQGGIVTAVSGYVSMTNGDGVAIELGQPGYSSGTGTFLPYYLPNCY